MEPTAPGFTALERDVVEALLAGEGPGLLVLREQWKAAGLSGREMTGVGFYANIAVPPEVARLADRNMQIGDVIADIVGLRHEAGFILWVEGGVLSFLEGCTFGEQWPEVVESYTLRYEPALRDAALISQRPTDKRQRELTQATPVRKRRRWLIVTLVLALLLASLVSWWNWPRGDARFIGTWSAEAPARPQAMSDRIELVRNGRGRFQNADGSLTIHFAWYVDGDELIMGSAPGRFDRALDWMAMTLAEIGGRTFLPSEERFSIIEIRADAIDLLSPNRDPLRMTRLPV